MELPWSVTENDYKTIGWAEGLKQRISYGTITNRALWGKAYRSFQ